MAIRVEAAEPYQMAVIAEFHERFLADRQEQDFNLFNNDETRNHYIIEFGRAIQEGRGVFVAIDDDGIAGVLWWIIDESPIKTRYRFATSHGQKVRPGMEGKGVIKEMIGFAASWMRSRGVDKVLDWVNDDPEILEHAEGAGFEQTNLIVVKDL